MNENYPHSGDEIPPVDDDITADDLGFGDLDDELDVDTGGRTRAIVAGAAALAVVALAVVGAVVLTGESSGVVAPPDDQPAGAGHPSGPATSTNTATETVPSLVGLTVKKAVAAVTQYGLSPRISYADGGVPGTVLETWPSAGTTVPRGSTVQLVVARDEPVTFAMPDLVGVNEPEARSLLKKAGWRGDLEVRFVHTFDQSQDGLIERHEPSPGTQVATGDSIELDIRQYAGEPDPSTEMSPPQRDDETESAP